MRESGRLKKQQGHVLDAVKEMPGRTAREYDESYPAIFLTSEGMFHRRLGELETAGLIRRGEVRKCRVGGRNAATWFPVDNDGEPK